MDFVSLHQHSLLPRIVLGKRSECKTTSMTGLFSSTPIKDTVAHGFDYLCMVSPQLPAELFDDSPKSISDSPKLIESINQVIYKLKEARMKRVISTFATAAQKRNNKKNLIDYFRATEQKRFKKLSVAVLATLLGSLDSQDQLLSFLSKLAINDKLASGKSHSFEHVVGSLIDWHDTKVVESLFIGQDASVTDICDYIDNDTNIEEIAQRLIPDANILCSTIFDNVNNGVLKSVIGKVYKERTKHSIVKDLEISKTLTIDTLVALFSAVAFRIDALFGKATKIWNFLVEDCKLRELKKSGKRMIQSSIEKFTDLSHRFFKRKLNNDELETFNIFNENFLFFRNCLTAIPTLYCI